MKACFLLALLLLHPNNKTAETHEGYQSATVNAAAHPRLEQESDQLINKSCLINL